MPLSPSKSQNFELYQGTTRRVQVTVTGTNPSTATTITWRMIDEDGVAVMTKTNDGNNINGATSGLYYLNFFRSDTVSLKPGTYTHEHRIKDASGDEDVTTIGTVTIVKSHTL